MEQAEGSSLAEQSHSPTELQLLRLVICGMRAAARAASAGAGQTRARSLEAAACRVIARQACRDHEFVHGLWCNLRAASLRKLRAHLMRGDATATRERLSALDWAVVDLLLLYDTPLLSVASFHQRAQLRALERTFQLVQQMHLESEDGEVAPDRWSRAAHEYSTNGVQLSAVALQRRWHELKLDARRRACAPAQAGCPRPLVLPIHQAVGTRYPHIVNSSELLTWRELVAAGKVAEPTSERGPAPGETRERSHTASADPRVETIDLSDDDSDHNQAQGSSSRATIFTVPDDEPAGSSYSNNTSKWKSRKIKHNISTSKESDIGHIDIEIKPEIIEIDDDEDAPSPKENVVEAMQEISFSNVDATVVYGSDEEDVKTVFGVKIGNVDKDAENAILINDNVLSNDSEKCILSGEINNEVKVESNLNSDNDITIAQSKDVCKNIADIKIDIEEHNFVKKEGSSEMKENEVECSSPNLNIQIKNIRQMIGVTNDSENVINTETVDNSVSCKNFENLSSDQLIDEILSKCKVVPDFNDEHSILRLVLSRDRRQNTTKIDHNDTTRIEDTEVQNHSKIEASSETDKINVKPISNIQSGGVHKDAGCSRIVNKLSKKDDSAIKMSEYFIDANLIKSKIESHFNDNYIDPKLLMWPVIVLRRIDEVLNIPLKKSQPTYSESLNHKLETDIYNNEKVNCEGVWKTMGFELTPELPLTDHKPSSVRPTYSRMFYEKNKVLLRKCKPCAVLLRRVDEDWGRVGGERGRKVRLPDMEKVRRSHRGILTAEVAPLEPTLNTTRTNKRLRPNTPENFQSTTSLPSIPNIVLEPTPLQNPFRPLVPPPWRQTLRPPEASLPSNNSYQNPLMIDPANQPDYLIIPSQLNQRSPIGTILQNALSYPRDFSPNSSVPFQNIIPNHMLNAQNAHNYPHGLQNMTSNNWPQTSETQSVFTHMAQREEVASMTRNMVTHNVSTPNVLPQPLTQIQEAAAAAATQNILHNILTRNTPTNQNTAIQNQNVETQNILTTPLPELQEIAAATATQHILNNILTQNAIQNMPAQNIGNQNIQIQNIPTQNLATQNISTPNIATQNIPVQNWPLVNMPGIQLPLPQTGISNIHQPRLTIDGNLIAQGFQGIILKREDLMQQNLQTTSQGGQIINPGSQPNPFLVNPVSCVNTAPNLTLNQPAMPNINNQVFLSNSLQPPPQMMHPPPLIDISIPTSVEGTNTRLPEVSDNTRKTMECSDDVLSNENVPDWKDKLPVHLNQAIPIKDLFQLIPKDYTSKGISYKRSDVLDWRSEPFPSCAFVRDRKGEVQRVLCTGPGQGWRLQGHLLVSEHRRPPLVAAIWSLRPRVRLQLPTPDKHSTGAEAAPNLVFQDRVYQKLSDSPLTYALVLVAVDSTAACLRLLARGAALQLYSLRTGVLHPVEAQRLDDGSFLLSGGVLTEAALAELTRRLHPTAPRRLAPRTPAPRPPAPRPPAPRPPAPRPPAPRPPSPRPSAPILSALISAAPRPPAAQKPPDTVSSAPILSALISAARRPPTPRPITPTLQPGPSAPIWLPPRSPPRRSASASPAAWSPTPTSAPRPISPTLQPGPSAPIYLPPRSPPRRSASASPAAWSPTPTSAPIPSTPTSTQRPPGLRPVVRRPPARRPTAPKRAPKRKQPAQRSLRPGAPTVPVSALMPSELQPTPRSSRYTAPHPDWELSEAAFVAKYRLPKLRVRALADELAPHIPNNRVNKILSCLTYLGSSNARPFAGAAAVIHALNHNSILTKYISFPHQRDERNKIINRFKELYKLPNVLGVIDGVQVPVHDVPPLHEEAFLNRAGFYSLNVQVICDADLNVLSVDAHQGGHVHDCALWAAHALNHRLTALHQAGEAVWLLGDSGYLQRETLMTPFPTPADPPEAQYNALHAHAWDSIKQCIHKLRARWRRLTTKISEKKARKIINACVVLHNIAQECGAPAPEVDLSRQTKIDALLEEHQESAIVSLMTAPDRDKLLREWRMGVVARDVLVQRLKTTGRHTPSIYRRTHSKEIGHNSDSSR